MDVRIDIIREASKDYSYLINRGFSKKQSLALITSRYQLSKKERMFLYRSIHSQTIARNINLKKVSVDEVENEVLLIDGLNVLLTIVAALKCDLLVLGDDGFLRDLQSVHGKIKYDLLFFKAINRLAYSLSILNPREVLVFFDKNVKMIGFYSNIIKKTLSKYVDKISIILAHMCDKEILAHQGIVSSSDIVVLQRAYKVFDLAGYIVRTLMRYPNIYEVKNNI